MSNLARQIYEALLSYETRQWVHKLRHNREYRELRSIVHPSPKGDFSLKPFDEHKCIFIHITKSAGTSVAQSLFGYLPYHYTAIDYRVIYGRKLFKSYFKFAFVRNPWDRLYSAFRYLKAGGWNDDDKRWNEQNLSEYDSFESFIKIWLDKRNIMQHRHFWPQYRFLCDNNYHLLVDYLGYFETLDEDFRKICSRLNIDCSLGAHNTNPGESYGKVYTGSMRQKVADVYARDIELFGYEFDGIANRKVITA